MSRVRARPARPPKLPPAIEYLCREYARVARAIWTSSASTPSIAARATSACSAKRCSVSACEGEEFPGKHQALVTEELYQRVQARRNTGRGRRRPTGPSGLLQGRLYCGHCGRKLHSERNYHHEPRYRERHGVPCVTNGRSLLARRVDAQLAELWRALEFPEDWRERMTEYASRGYEGPDLAALNDRRRRLARVFGDGVYSDTEYAALCQTIDEQIRAAAIACGPSHEEAARLFADMPALWDRATNEERRALVEPLIERAYVDIDSGMIGGIRATPEFSSLIDHGLRRVPSSRAVVLTSTGDSRHYVECRDGGGGGGARATSPTA